MKLSVTGSDDDDEVNKNSKVNERFSQNQFAFQIGWSVDSRTVQLMRGEVD